MASSRQTITPGKDRDDSTDEVEEDEDDDDKVEVEVDDEESEAEATAETSGPQMDDNVRTCLTEIVGLDDDEIAVFEQDEYTKMVHLRLLDGEEVDRILPDTAARKKRTLLQVVRFLQQRQQITDMTTIESILDFLSGDNQSLLTPTMYSGTPVGKGHRVATVSPEDPLKGAPKFTINSLEKFGGDALEWPEWEQETKATIRQSIYSDYLDRPPTEGNAAEMRRNMEFYNSLFNAVRGGGAKHVMKGQAVIDNGHAAWKALCKWYGSSKVSRTIVKHHQQVLDELRLDEQNTATSYINDFIVSSQELEERGEGMTSATKRESFLAGITDPDYDVIVQQLSGDEHATFESCVNKIREREQRLLIGASQTAAKRARRGRQDESYESSTTTTKPKVSIPFFPKHLLSRIESEELRTDLLNWRTFYYKEGRSASPDDLAKMRKSGNGKKSGEGSPDNGNSRNGKRKRGKARRTQTVVSGTQDGPEAIRISIKDTHDDVPIADDDDNDGQPGSKNPASTSTGKAGLNRKHKAARRTGSGEPNVGACGGVARGVIDPGTDYEVIGGVGWEVETVTNVTTSMGGYFTDDDGRCRLPIVSAISAYEHPRLGTVLLGIGAAAWDDRPEQTESLLNSHELRLHGVEVDDKAARDGGGQKLVVDGIDIDLTFENGRLLYIPLRRPTREELENQEVHWLIPKTPAATSVLLQRRTQATVFPEQAPWEERLGSCPARTVERTLSATTQLCSGPIEMDNRESPRQHRKSRLLPLHPIRVEGRTDSDTYYCSPKSIRGFTCV